MILIILSRRTYRLYVNVKPALLHDKHYVCSENSLMISFCSNEENAGLGRQKFASDTEVM